MKKRVAKRAVHRLPVALRLLLARWTLWRLNQSSLLRPIIVPMLLLTCVGLGYLLGSNRPMRMNTAHAESDVSLPRPLLSDDSQLATRVDAEHRLAREIGRLQAEIVSLRVLFLRLADVAELDEGEFELDMNFQPLMTIQPGAENSSMLGRVMNSWIVGSGENAADGTAAQSLPMHLRTPQLDSSGANSTVTAAAFSLDEAPREGQAPLQPSITHENEGLTRLPMLRESQWTPTLLRAIDSLPLAKQTLAHMSRQAERLAGIYRLRRLEHDLRVSGMPVEQAIITSRYGYRSDPLTGRRQLHLGLDLAGKPGSRVSALADGIVTFSGRNGGYGNLLELEHANGYRTRYAHNRTLLVSVGTHVKKGQTIALMGSSGRTTGTHLHVEVRRHGHALDPQLYVR